MEIKGKPAAVEHDTEDADDADEETASEDDAPACTDAKVDKAPAFGMTLDQMDEADRLLDLLRAQGDLLMAGGGGDSADGTIIVIGSAIFDNAEEMKDMIRQISRQTLDAKSGGGSRVREMPAAYGTIDGSTPARLAAHRPNPDASGVRLH
ncbi:hypothetical protein [Luteimonas deserti]|uniref:Uncharacterized protein n=1 Tax=Luteimonas deserti TaxID=2752306 RepID=A0A7Z0TV76_9GAMM|nr:hypothetical protein [Luteimonas deserti]NYZ61954.1 hypothetical protein [Luteimonas deserti]